MQVDRAALVDELPAGDRVSVRIDPALTMDGKPAGRLRREAPDTLVFRRGRGDTGRVAGEPLRLDLLEEIVGGRSTEDATGVQLPRDLGAFERRAHERRDEVMELLREGREKVERVERLVCALYGLAEELTEAVVEHALKRAARPASSD